jgi:hypothetical protein
VVFMLRDQRESLINFLLPNDDAFQRLYDEMVGRLQQRAVMNPVLRYNASFSADGAVRRKLRCVCRAMPGRPSAADTNTRCPAPIHLHGSGHGA